MTMRVLDIFSCIGFHAIGLSRAGDFETVAFCESNPRHRQELARLFPETPIYEDARTMPAISADVIFGGPPTLAPMQPSHRATGERLGGKTTKTAKRPVKRRAKYHIVSGVRSHGANR